MEGLSDKERNRRRLDIEQFSGGYYPTYNMMVENNMAMEAMKAKNQHLKKQIRAMQFKIKQNELEEDRKRVQYLVEHTMYTMPDSYSVGSRNADISRELEGIKKQNKKMVEMMKHLATGQSLISDDEDERYYSNGYKLEPKKYLEREKKGGKEEYYNKRKKYYKKHGEMKKTNQKSINTTTTTTSSGSNSISSESKSNTATEPSSESRKDKSTNEHPDDNTGGVKSSEDKTSRTGNVAFDKLLQDTLSDNEGAEEDSDEEEERKAAETELKKQQELQRRRKIVEAMSGGSAYAVPMWRHIASGNPDPPFELVLRGKSLFRSGVTAVWFIEALKSQDFKRKIKTKSVEQNALKEELDIFHNILKYWLVKTLRIPISSIGLQKKLDLSLKINNKKNRVLGIFVGANTKKDKDFFLSKVRKIKVRIKGIIDDLKKSLKESMVPSILTLVAKLVTDGNYFPNNFLWESEKKQLEFTKLGQTRFMIIEQKEETKEKLEEYDQYKRARLLVLNILIKKILIPHIMLQPWSVGLGKQSKDGMVELNLKIVSTCLYNLVQKVCPGGLEPGKKSKGSETDEKDESEILKEKEKVIERIKSDEKEQESADTKMKKWLSEEEISEMLLPSSYFEAFNDIFNIDDEWWDIQALRLKEWSESLLLMSLESVKKTKGKLPL